MQKRSPSHTYFANYKLLPDWKKLGMTEQCQEMQKELSFSSEFW